jgi:hypothetical protein
MRADQVGKARKAQTDTLGPVRPVVPTLLAGALDPARRTSPSGDFRDRDAIGA